MEISDSKIKKFLIFSQKKASRNGNLKKIPCISGNGTCRAGKVKKPSEKASYILGNGIF